MYELDVESDGFRRDPYPMYRAAREGRLCLIRPFNIYALTRYEDVAPALRDYRRFSSEGMHTFFLSETRTKTRPLGRTMVSLDPPRHFAVRRLVSGIFDTIDMVEAEQFARRVVEELLPREERSGTLDVVLDIAAPLALRVIAWVIGAEQERMADFLRWTDDASGNALRSAPHEIARVERSHEEMREYFVDRIHYLRARPDGRFISQLIAAQDTGVLTEDELLDLSRFLLFAGNKTTRSFVGNSVIALSRQPRAYAALQERPGQLPALVDELLRFDTPSQLSIRTLTEEVIYDGVSLKAGMTIFLLNGSANRDERRFPDPDRLDLQRNTSGHLGLGAGTHHCLGEKMAKMQAKVALEALRRRPGAIHIDEASLEYYPPLFLRGPKRLLLSYTGQ